MTTRSCTSKYHMGERNISIDMFRSNKNGTLPNRCINCERKTTSNYQKTERGRQTKKNHYDNNKEIYKQTEKRNRSKLIETNGGSSYLFITAKRRAKRYGLEFTLSPSDVIIPDMCPVLHIPLLFSDVRTNNTPSIDRIDNNKGYIPENIKVISWRANFMKRDLSMDEITKLYHYMITSN